MATFDHRERVGFLRDGLLPDDILAYLVAALDRLETEGVIEVGTDPLTFRQMMPPEARVTDAPQ